MQHICLDEIGKEFDLGAAQGSMDQSVHSSAKVLDSSWVNFGKLMKSDERIQKWNHPNVVVVQDCLHCLLSIQWFYIVLQLLTPEHQSAKLPDVWMFEVKADLRAVHYSLGHALSGWTAPSALLHVECRTSVGVVVFLSCAISAQSCFCPPLLLAGCCTVSFSAAYVQLFCFWCWPLAISVGPLI